MDIEKSAEEIVRERCSTWTGYPSIQPSATGVCSLDDDGNEVDQAWRIGFGLRWLSDRFPSREEAWEDARRRLTSASAKNSDFVMAPTLQIGQEYGTECCNALNGHHPNCPTLASAKSEEKSEVPDDGAYEAWLKQNSEDAEDERCTSHLHGFYMRKAFDAGRKLGMPFAPAVPAQGDVSVHDEFLYEDCRCICHDHRPCPECGHPEGERDTVREMWRQKHSAAQGAHPRTHHRSRWNSRCVRGCSSCEPQ